MLAFSDHGEQQEPEGTASYAKGLGQHAGPERPGVGRGETVDGGQGLVGATLVPAF